MTNQYVPIDRIFAKLSRDIRADIDEDDVIEWTGEALEFIGTKRVYEEAIAFYEVKNYTCPVPPLTHQIIQIARNNKWTPENLCVTPAGVIEETQNVMFQKCDSCGGSSYSDEPDMGYVVLDGKGTPVLEYDIAYYRPYFDLLGEYYGWSNSKHFCNGYTPVRLSTSNFFNSVVDKNHDGSLYPNCKDEYTIVSNNVLRFSFCNGFVAIAHKRQPVDTATGYPMIPDSIAHITAISSYIKMKMNDRDLFDKREGSIQLSQKLEGDWQWYCGVASNQDKMPNGIDEHQNLLDQRSYFLPDYNKYYNFFGNLNTPEYRKFNDSDSRNRRLSYVVGH